MIGWGCVRITWRRQKPAAVQQIRRSSPQTTLSHVTHWTHHQHHPENANPQLESHNEGGRVETISSQRTKQRAFLQTRALKRLDDFKNVNMAELGKIIPRPTETQRRNCSPPDHTDRNRPKHSKTILDDIDGGYIYI